LLAVLANLFRDPKKPPYSAEDFLKEKQTPEQMLRKIERFNG
jgi:hypothetical protein